jgi:hypothetical protein
VKPVRSPGYLEWIRTLPCLVCHRTRSVEAVHTGPHGLGQKSSDLSAIPLCARHHRSGDDSYHKLGPRKFAEVHQLNVRAIVARLSARPCIRVESGSFVGRFGSQEYELGSTEAGLAQAIHRMSGLRREMQAEVPKVLRLSVRLGETARCGRSALEIPTLA